MNKVINYFSEIPFKKLVLFNFLFGLLLGFPFMIGTIILTFSKSLWGFFIIVLSILIIIGLNILLNKKTKNRVKDYNVYQKLFATFLFLGFGMFSISQLSFLFMSIKA